METTTLERKAEIKARTTSNIKAGATEIYSQWGLSLSDAINLFLIKSIEVGGLPFEMRIEKPTFEALSERAYHPEINDEGVAILSAEWDEDEQ